MRGLEPNPSTYNRLIRKLQRVSVDGSVDADVRRLATDEYQRMIVAKEPRRRMMSSASYSNLYGNGAALQANQDLAIINAEITEAMTRVLTSAARFVAMWKL